MNIVCARSYTLVVFWFTHIITQTHEHYVGAMRVIAEAYISVTTHVSDDHKLVISMFQVKIIGTIHVSNDHNQDWLLQGSAVFRVISGSSIMLVIN